MVSAGNSDIFVVKHDPAGNQLWSKRFGAGEQDIANSVAADPSGNVLLTGTFGAGIDFGGGVLTTGVGAGYEIRE
jgi:hypothetical protein